jgi:serine protease AprX
MQISIKRTLNLAALFVAATTFTYAAHNPKVDKDLEGKNPNTPLSVIIQYKQGAKQKHLDAVAAKGGQHKGNLDLVKGAVFSIKAKDLDALANDPDVELISPDHEIKGSGSVIPIDYYRETVGADLADSAGWDGTGIGVAIIDSGITTNSDLLAPVYSQSFVTETATSDGYGHGTHVAGILTGSGSNSSGDGSKYKFGGAARKASIINLRALNSLGIGTDSTVINAIQRAIALKTTYNIRHQSLAGPARDHQLPERSVVPGCRSGLECRHRRRRGGRQRRPQQ